ncbi:hypothetical protein C8A03DRAFT_43878 [Achaetomium macrosporum]|uniref:Cupin type-2 domain-containing protein n=1 Tax=Achaetomium macrosporum TaxID=79813 RepID=A0AAN7CAD4_9PEZI|nr:hypothetical protein C8A03DRAFT_43878 [Achaetomium macrosporum]
MARSWQLWLSPRPLRRTETPVEPRMLSADDASLYEFLYEADGRLVVKETHYASNKQVLQGASGPPLHIHLRQTEHFQVLQGTLAAVKNEKEVRLTKDDGILTIEPGVRHRFWADSSINSTHGDLVFTVWAEPQDVERGFDENFLRNIVGYLRDCAQQSITPSLFQIALFGWAGDTLLICPPFYVPLWMLKAAQYVAGHVVGYHLLG